MQCRARGHDVVHQRDVRRKRVVADGERATWIASSCNCAKPALRRDVADALKAVGQEWNRERFRKWSRQLERLVVAALAQAFWMQWYGDQGMWTVDSSRHGRFQNSPHCFGQFAS